MAMRITLFVVCAFLFGCASVRTFDPVPAVNVQPLAKRECNDNNANCDPVVLSVAPSHCATDRMVDPGNASMCKWSFADPIDVGGRRVTVTWTLPSGFVFCTSNLIGSVMKDGAYLRPNKDFEPVDPADPVSSGLGRCWRSFKVFNKKDATGIFPYQLVFRREIDGAAVIIDPSFINR
jgi:hypothetical protein